MARLDLSNENIQLLGLPNVKQASKTYTSKHLAGLTLVVRWRATQNRVSRETASANRKAFFRFIWRFRYTWEGRRTSIDLGHWPAVNQELAIAQAKSILTEVVTGVDPAEKRRVEKEVLIPRTVVASESAVNYLLDSFYDWRKDKYPRKVNTNRFYLKAINNHIRPRFGLVRYDVISPWVWSEFLRELKTKNTNNVARSVHATWRAINTYAVRSDEFPGVGINKFLNLEAAKGLQARPRKRFFSNLELYTWMNEYALRGTPTQARVLMLQLYQGLRISEILNIEIDQLRQLVDSEIPITVKGGRLGYTMVSSWAIELIKDQLRYLKESKLKNKYLFPHHKFPERNYTTVEAGSFVTAVRKDWLSFSTHDLRRTARTWLQEFGCSVEMRDVILNHAVPVGKNASYDHSKRRDEQLRWLQLWADKLNEIKVNPDAFQMDANTAINSDSARELLSLLDG